jgi:hypothetical protein
MDLRCVTRNLGRRTAAGEWVLSAASGDRAAAIMFLQELPVSGITVPVGYTAVPIASSDAVGTGDYVCRSALLLRDAEVRLLEVLERESPVRALGPYGVAARVDIAGESFLLVSVHASPRELGDVVLPEGLTPRVRTPCERVAWWSDVALAGLRGVSAERLLVAGDFNEAREWDKNNRNHSCSVAFFKEVAEVGLVDATWEAWGREHPTRANPHYQLDRVFHSKDIASRVRMGGTPAPDPVSDHAPIWFSLL